jgi:hypothetical protein
METQKTVKLDLSSLTPQEATFKLSSRPDKIFTLVPFTLRVQAHAMKTWGAEGLEKIIATKPVLELAELGYFQLKDKSQFKSFDDFLDAVVTFIDRDAVVAAVLLTVGLSQPVIEGLEKQLEEQKQGNDSSPAQTGQPSTT